VTRVQVMVKTIGAMCNLDCTYCYCLSKGDLLCKPDHWAMSEETLETFIRRYFEANNFEEVVFSWQGGEPPTNGFRSNGAGQRPQLIDQPTSRALVLLPTAMFVSLVR